MGIISWIILGGLAGFIASRITDLKEGMGLLANIGVGIAGSAVGGFLANLVSRNPVFSFNVQSIFVAVLGTVVFLAILRALWQN